MSIRNLAAVLLVFIASRAYSQEPPASPDGTRFYIALFSYQQPKILTRADLAHTFATVMKVSPGPNGAAIESHTISWLPTDGDIRVSQIRSEPGRNYTLEETARLARSSGLRITMWGPFEVRERFFNRFRDRKQDLDSGRFRYRAVDTLIRETEVTDCIHAITDIDRKFNRGRYPLSRFGDRATAFIVDQMRMRGGLLNDARTHDELIPALGLDAFTLVRRNPPPEIAYPLADFGLAIRPQSRMVRR